MNPPAMCGPDVLDFVDRVFGSRKATVPWPSWEGSLPTTTTVLPSGVHAHPSTSKPGSAVWSTRPCMRSSSWSLRSIHTSARAPSPFAARPRMGTSAFTGTGLPRISKVEASTA